MIRSPEISRRRIASDTCSTSRSFQRYRFVSVIGSHLEKVTADDDLTGEVRPHGIVPHLVRDERVAARYEMREHERLHACLGREAADLFGRGVAREQMVTQRR